MNEKEKKLLVLSCFLGGIVAGFLLSPIRRGIYFGNGNSISNAGNDISNSYK